tara:strand:- start:14784 stop:16439 length:1656 start_codon:yes stop_codon:yes gene_type:complete
MGWKSTWEMDDLSFEKPIFDIKLLSVIFLCVLLQESVYASDSIFEKTIAEITRESLLPSVGENGRPLPLVGHWNRGQLAGGYDPKYQFNLIKNGHHLLPWFHFPMPGEKWNADYYAVIEEYRKLNLPISFIGTQWERILSEDNSYLELEEKLNPNVVNLAGSIERKVSPFGRAKDWRDVGERWTNNEGFLTLQDLYPNPPLILFVSNNEHKKMRWHEALLSRRFIEKYGLLNTPNEIKKIIGDKWIDLYANLFDGMLDGIKSEHWKGNLKFIGYNAFLTGSFGRWPGWLKYSLVIPGRIEPWSHVWDGASVPYYTHDWNKSSDFTVMSPQIQAMNQLFAQDDFQRTNRHYWFEMSVWDGNSPEKQQDKQAYYKSLGQSYSPDRYKGYVKFGMWLLRPRLVREFRGWSDTVNRTENYFLQIVDAVDDIYRSDLLSKFWRYGELVKNDVLEHPYQSMIPSELKEKSRWFLLDANVNPIRPWRLNDELKVFSIALCIGENKDQEWLLYTYSPLDEYKDVKLTLPGYGIVELNSTPKGEYYHLKKNSDELINLKI